MSRLEAICSEAWGRLSANHAFSVVATGGFSTKDESIAAFATPFIEWWTILIMIMVGLNFTLWGAPAGPTVLRDLETKTYLDSNNVQRAYCTGACRLAHRLARHRRDRTHRFFAALRHGTFVTVAMQTGTILPLGLLPWPYLTVALIFGLAAIVGAADPPLAASKSTASSSPCSC